MKTQIIIKTMKQLSFYPLIALFFVLAFSCKYNDDPLWDSVKNLDNRVANLEKLCNQANVNINSLQTIVQVLQGGDYVVGIVPVIENGKEVGYKISFSENNSIIVYHGKDGSNGTNGSDGANGVNGVDGLTPIIGSNGNWWIGNTDTGVKAQGINGSDGTNGTNGTNGVDGANGITPNIGGNGNWWIGNTDTGVKAGAIDGQNGSVPIIGVKKDTDGLWYWTQKIGTANATWILDENGNKIEVNRESGNAPIIGVNQSGNWTVDYGNGAEEITDAGGNPIKAQGEKGDKGEAGTQGEKGEQGIQGENGEVGNSIFQNITQDGSYIYFTLSDGTLIFVPKLDEEKGIIKFEDPYVKAICLSHWDENEDRELSYEEAAKVTSIAGVFNEKDIFAFNELKYFTSLTSIGKEFAKSPNLITICLPNSIEKIDDQAFYILTSPYSSLSSISFGDGVKAIGKQAFYGCRGLTSVIIPDNVTSIGTSAFNFCIGLTSVVIGSSVKIIESSAFSSCHSLTSVVIGSSVTQIWGDAFSTTKLEKIYFKTTNPPISSSAAFNTETCILYVPKGCVQAFKSNPCWGSFKNIIEME